MLGQRATFFLMGLLFVIGCEEPAYEFDLPATFPSPRVPEDNPMSDARVELGRHLFYDSRLSGNETQSCATCHVQALAFTDGRAQGLGSTGDMHPRGSMSLANVGYAATMNWSNPVVRDLESQALTPMFGEDPVELGLAGMEETLLTRIASEPVYASLFAAAFPGEAEPIQVANITRAIAAFERTLISGNSAYDRFLAGESEAISDSALRGAELFFGEELECFHCHGGFLFSSAVDHEGNVFDQASFQNNGLYNLDGRGAYPANNPGLAEFTGDPADQGSFKPPTLRNIGVTGPYMHDGSIATLEEVVRMYAAGGRNTTEGPNFGDGRTNPNKSIFVNGFELDDQGIADVVAFLESLTDEAFLNDPRHANPWTERPRE